VLGWLNLPHLPTLPLPLTAKHRVVKFYSSRSAWARDRCLRRKRHCEN